MKKRPLIFAFASIPPRVKFNVAQLVHSFRTSQTRQPDLILMSYPKTFRRFPGVHRAPHSVPGLIVHVPEEDAGPATKWLGALEYIEQHPELRDAFLVIGDDDIDYKDTFLELMLRRLQEDDTKVYAGFIEHEKIGPLKLSVAQGCSGVGVAARLAVPLLKLPRFEECFETDDVWISNAFQQLGLDVVNVVPGVNEYSATRKASHAYQAWLAQNGISDAGGLAYLPNAGTDKNTLCALAVSETTIQRRQFVWRVVICVTALCVLVFTVCVPMLL